MKTQLCPVKECGARVIMVDVEGRPFAVNPVRMELALPAGEGRFRVVTGYQPHDATCVDIQTRRRASAPAGR